MRRFCENNSDFGDSCLMRHLCENNYNFGDSCRMGTDLRGVTYAVFAAPLAHETWRGPLDAYVLIRAEDARHIIQETNYHTPEERRHLGRIL